MSICHWPTASTPCSHLITALFSELLHCSPPLTAPGFPMTVLFPFLDHSPQILVLHLHLLLHSPFLSLPWTDRAVSHCWRLELGFFFSLAMSPLAWLALGKSLSLQQGMQSPCPVHQQVPSFAEVFLGSSWLSFYQGRAFSSALALGSLFLTQSPQTLLLRSFSWLFILFHTFCSLALLSSTCCVSQLVLHHFQLSSLCSSVSFSPMGLCSCNHFHAFSCALRCLRKPTKLTAYYLKF